VWVTALNKEKEKKKDESRKKERMASKGREEKGE
jgi:hypothetical protein